MEEITHWAGNIVSYLVFLTALNGLLPAHKYEKYVRLFAGCILLLIVLKPLTDGLRLEERLNYLFTSFSFKNETGELKDQMDAIEVQRRNMLLSEYETQASKEAVRVAREAGFLVEHASVELEKDPASEAFATVRSVTVYVAPEEMQGDLGAGGEDGEAETGGQMERESNSGSSIQIKEIAPVDISSGVTGKTLKGQSRDGNLQEKQSKEKEPQENQQWQQEKSQEQPAAAQVVSWADGARIGELQRRLASFYQVEADHVEVRMDP